MKQIMYGSVSALALLLAVHGAAHAQSAVTTATNAVELNTTAAENLDTTNDIDDMSFAGASGAFQVQQNNSIQGKVAQNAAVSAEVTTVPVLVVSEVGQSISAAANTGNTESADTILSSNTIDNGSFAGASGEFQVQQNNAINSDTTQNASTAAVSDPGASVTATQISTASLTNDVTADTSAGNTLTNTNIIDDSSFAGAAGEFQVQQNASVNSSVQQNASIAAVSAPGGSILATQASEADLESTVASNSATLDVVTSANIIDNGSFAGASGVFQVQQNNSINSAVSQNLAISAVSTH